MTTRKLGFVLAALALASAVVACGETATTAPASDTADDHPEFSFGEPADAASADRVIEITASDDFRFDPASIEVSAGETATFRVTNIGAIPHDFTLGDESTQQAHAEEMEEMAGMSMPDEPNAMVVAPGETRELTWHFTKAGDLLIGCHETGHYAAGMIAQVTVQG
ncbi:MAG TPA: plastocyanin/azurin family copper-binding protein [Acidimicrobiia bacterium]|nr:plastocyanin/azurin family copper-binding protein [Acidimicrobiia bacterium]